MNKLTIGTRGSALALAQVDLTEAALARVLPGLATERKIFVTRGDQKLDLNLLTKGDGGGKGLFTRELEEALGAGTIDVAVHSLKDLPGHMPEGLELVAVLERAPTADILISRHPDGLAGLPQCGRVGTSSIRRARQIAWKRPDLRIEEWRGNVPTRLRKFSEQGEVAGIVLAEAGLRRLGYSLEGGILKCESGEFPAASLASDLLPAIGQGAVALQIRADRSEVREVISAINHAPTMLAIRAEREVQRLLGGDCSMPVGVRTAIHGGVLTLQGILFHADAAEPRLSEATGTEPEAVARELVAVLR